MINLRKTIFVLLNVDTHFVRFKLNCGNVL